MKPDAPNVVRFGSADIRSDRRAAFLVAVAQTFDRYVSEFGFEPEAIVYLMNGLKQPSLVGWDIQGESQGGPASILSLGAVHLMAEAQAGRQGLLE